MPTQRLAQHSYHKGNDWNHEQKRLERIQKKHEKMGMLKAILEMQEKLPNRDVKREMDLARRIREIRTQLVAMG